MSMVKKLKKTHTIYQSSKTHTALNTDEVDDKLPEIFQTIHTKFQEFQREGSGWVFDKVNHFVLINRLSFMYV